MQVEFLVCLVLAVVVRSEIILGTPGLHFNQNVEYAASYHNYQPRDYAYDYAVSDPHTGDHKSQWEIKEKGVVRGSYSLLEPDGTTRIVEYVADDLGFRAVVKKIGHSLHPGGLAIQSVEAHGIPSAPVVAAPVVAAAPIAVQPEVHTFSSYDGHAQNYANVAVQPIEIPQSVQYQAPLYAQQVQAQHIQARVLTQQIQPQLYQNVQPVIREQVSYQAQPVQQAQVYAQPIKQSQVYAQPIEQAQIYAQPIQQSEVYAQPIQQPQVYAQSIQQPQVYAQSIQQPQVHAQSIQQPQIYAQSIQQPQVYAQPILKEQLYQNIQAQPIQQYAQAQPILQEQAYQNIKAEPVYQNIQQVEQYPQAVSSGILAHAAQSTQNQVQLPSANYGLQGHQQLVEVPQPRYVESSQIHGLTGNLEDDSRYSNDHYQLNDIQQGGYQLSIPIGNEYQGGYGIESPRSYRNVQSKRSKSHQPFLIKA